MALIKCNECNNEVSDKANACPKCGAPIAAARETKAAGTQIKTIQETSKKFKLQTLISVSLIIVGMVWFIAVLSEQQSEPSATSAIPSFLIVIGFGWYIVNRFRIWWHHK
ncbi:MAG: zinc-ribbon domain-containing protein [Desulfobacteraceae bacterium]|nr:zinc-ribbon domain-containing protein [Desulfobacteraceae bacterium]